MAIIKLEKPFSDIWNKGYLRTHSSGRKLVDLFNTNEDRTTISYARYLKCCELGYILSDEYEVDHVDEDNTNDTLSNLQVLSVEEHRLKHSLSMSTGRTKLDIKCPHCGKIFTREKRQSFLVKEYLMSFCSRSCNGSFKSKEYSQDELKQIGINSIQRVYK